jgi:hypothetical protein
MELFQFQSKPLLVRGDIDVDVNIDKRVPAVGPAREVDHGATRHFCLPVHDVAGVRHKGDIPRSAEALLPPHECGGRHRPQKYLTRRLTLRLKSVCENREKPQR